MDHPLHINYQSELVQLTETSILDILDLLKTGLLYAEEALILHDNSLGRTTSKNKLYAERIEKYILKFKEIIKKLDEYKRN